MHISMIDQLISLQTVSSDFKVKDMQHAIMSETTQNKSYLIEKAAGRDFLSFDCL